MPELSYKERSALEMARVAFEAWWEDEGQFLDLDQRGIAGMAFVAGIGSVGDTIN